jgi:uncharacterized membrane protein YraQ (UPF0718 family)
MGQIVKILNFVLSSLIHIWPYLLIGGVPLAPLMSFWIASPSMDPEIFFLSVSTVGWKLSVWRLAATFIISVVAGLITHYIMKTGFINNDILRQTVDNLSNNKKQSVFVQMKNSLTGFFSGLILKLNNRKSYLSESYYLMQNGNTACCIPVKDRTMITEQFDKTNECSCNRSSKNSIIRKNQTFNKISKETLKAVFMITKFMI